MLSYRPSAGACQEVMLDSSEEESAAMAARRRCRSLDSLPDVLLWYADDDNGDGAAVYNHVTSGLLRQHGDSAGRRCSLSTSDLLTAGDAAGAGGLNADESYDPSWCSVNNLETDCVSPRVSSNSLFSQLEAGTAASSDEVAGGGDPTVPSYRLTAAGTGRRTPCGFGAAPGDVKQPMYTRTQFRRLPATASPDSPQILLPTKSLLRQLAAGGVTPRPPAGFVYDERRLGRLMSCSSRSASCPTLLDVASSSHQRSANNAMCLHVVHATADGDEGRGAQLRRGPAADDDVVDGIVAPVSLVTHSSSGARAPMQCLTARPTARSASPPLTTSSSPDPGGPSTWDRGSGVRRPLVAEDRKTRQRGASGSSSAATMNAGRTTQRLARTKCLQWLNSFDEDDWPRIM